METDNASLWQPLSDFFSNVVFYIRQWQLRPYQNDKTAIVLAIAGLLILYLLWRFFSAREQKEKPAIHQTDYYRGLDSEFFLIEQHLQNTPAARWPGESMQQWVKRLQLPELDALYRLHYRLRFDPLGLTHRQRQALREQSMAWLTQFQQND